MDDGLVHLLILDLRVKIADLSSIITPYVPAAGDGPEVPYPQAEAPSVEANRNRYGRWSGTVNSPMIWVCKSCLGSPAPTHFEGIVVNRSFSGEGYMLPLGGPEFWLQAELQDAMDRLVKSHFRDVLQMPRAPYPSLDLSPRMTSSAGRCYPDTGEIKIASLYHRDHGLDATLMVLKHELAHWGARWRYGRRIAPHGREFRAVAHELDPRITITCPPFAAKERSQRRTWTMQCPRCRTRYKRGRRDKVACAKCCDNYSGGNYDRRFKLVVVSRGGE